MKVECFCVPENCQLCFREELKKKKVGGGVGWNIAQSPENGLILLRYHSYTWRQTLFAFRTLLLSFVPHSNKRAVGVTEKLLKNPHKDCVSWSALWLGALLSSDSTPQKCLWGFIHTCTKLMKTETFGRWAVCVNADRQNFHSDCTQTFSTSSSVKFWQDVGINQSENVAGNIWENSLEDGDFRLWK